MNTAGAKCGEEIIFKAIRKIYKFLVFRTSTLRQILTFECQLNMAWKAPFFQLSPCEPPLIDLALLFLVIASSLNYQRGESVMCGLFFTLLFF